MTDISTEALIARAAALVRPKKLGDHLAGDVGCALLAADGHLYEGVCIDVGSGIGFCAEHSAIAAMITAGEYKIDKIVAVWKEGDEVYVLSPCGRCREFMRQVHPDNIRHTDVILGADLVVKLADLLPYDTWFNKTPG